MSEPTDDDWPWLNGLGMPPRPTLAELLQTPLGSPWPPRSPFTPTPERELPNSERRAAAWANLPEGPIPGIKITRERRLIAEHRYGDRTSDLGWEAGHIVAEADGGRAIRSNLIAQHWEDNAREGGWIGLRNALTRK
jgi:hypothetical protein